jgi:hypothetical protein
MELCIGGLSERDTLVGKDVRGNFRTETAQYGGVPLHDEYPTYSVFFECKNFWQKNDKIDVRYSSELAWYDFYLLVTEREDFKVVKGISKYSFGSCKT